MPKIARRTFSVVDIRIQQTARRSRHFANRLPVFSPLGPDPSVSGSTLGALCFLFPMCRLHVTSLLIFGGSDGRTRQGRTGEHGQRQLNVRRRSAIRGDGYLCLDCFFSEHHCPHMLPFFGARSWGGGVGGVMAGRQRANERGLRESGSSPKPANMLFDCQRGTNRQRRDGLVRKHKTALARPVPLLFL